MVDPSETGMLDVGDGHEIYWEMCGDAAGRPALFLHGGPGSGASPGQRGLFDPQLYRTLLFDQRGCGRSRPLASEPDADLSTNTTSHLIADIEALRRHRSIESWTVLGISWGTTLGLAYAEAHPGRVSALVLALVGTTSACEVDWLTRQMGRVFPEEWDRFSNAVPERLQEQRLVDAYAELLFDPDPEVRDHAAREWCRWEDTHVSLTPGHRPDERFENPEFRLGFARLVTHYWRHAAFLDEDQLLANASKLNGIPGVLIHGRHDVSSPLETAWRLTRIWTTSELHVLEDAGHGGAALAPAINDALTRLAAEPGDG